MPKYFKFIAVIPLLFFCFSCNNTPKQVPDTVDAIYFNGKILTMEDSLQQVEAIAVKAGKIEAIGDFETINQLQGAATQMIDLGGKTMLPGFVDAHSHFTIAMKMMAQANLGSPPAGEVKSIADIIEKLQAQQAKYNILEGQWIVGWGYDPDELEEKRHPNKLDLDTAFPNHPVFILHVSAHMAVVNSKALEIVGITDTTQAVEGGVIVKLPNSNEPSGLLQEKMVYQVIGKLPTPTEEQSLALLKGTQQLYASQGITTAQDGLTDLPTFQFLEKAAEKGLFTLDIEALGSFQNAKDWLTTYKDRFGQNKNRLRLAGIKIVGDGSPQGKTAFFSKPYLTEVPGCAHTCTGVPTVTQDQLNQLLQGAYNQGIQVFMHANGDGSIDMLLEAYENALEHIEGSVEDLRTVVIHSQFVRPDQLQQYKDFGFVPAFFTNHAFFWGDVHIENLGEERAAFLSPIKTSINMGLVCTNHTDYIVTPLNQLFTVWTAVNRTTRSGKILGEAERLTPWEALKAITINSAYQHKTEKIKGSIAVGKLADFVVLSDNPLKVEADKIKDIQILQTIKEGVVIYEK
ncbi:MAG: amidohydrolase [Chitinophagales bacterium]